MSLYPELEKLNLEELIAHFSMPHEHGSIYYGWVAFHIREQGQRGNHFLLKALKTINEDDEERLHALLVGLSSRPGRGIEPFSRYYKRWFVDRLRFYLHDDRPRILNVTIDGLYLLGVKREIDRILSLKDHPFVFVRESVMRYIGHLYPGRAFPILIEALSDQHEFVRSEAADQLGLLCKGEAIPHLQMLLDDSDPQVRESAQNAIQYIESDLALDRIMEKGSPEQQDRLIQLLEDALSPKRR
jgi:hypothetical protein